MGGTSKPWFCYNVVLMFLQPFNRAYVWNNSSANEILVDPSISKQNGFIGSATQQATSVVTDTNQRCYEFVEDCYSVYGFEVCFLHFVSSPSLIPCGNARKYKPGMSNSIKNLTCTNSNLIGYDDAVSRYAMPLGIILSTYCSSILHGYRTTR